MNKRKLTVRQERFVEEYLIDLNATQAAVRAGYSAKTAHSCGPRLLANAGVAAAISAAKQERAEATKIDAEYVLRKLHLVVERCLQEVKPALHSKTRQPMKDKDGNALFTFNAAGANQALALLGKHTAVAAFEDRFKHDHEMSVVAILQEGRRRVNRPDAVNAECAEVSQTTRREKRSMSTAR